MFFGADGRKPRAVRTTLLLAAVVAMGCRAVPGLPAEESVKATVLPSHRWVVAGCDISGSYHNAEPCLDMVVSVIQQEMRGGDRLYLRAIGKNSYEDQYAILTIVLPEGPTSVRNPWDPDESAALQLYQQKLATLKSRATARLLDAKEHGVQGLTKDDTRYTDELSFLAKAGELLAKAPASAQRVVLMGTDLIDTRRQGGLSINLAGASVVVGLFENSNAAPGEIQQRKSSWAREFKKYGARDVQFLDPAEGTGGTGGLLVSAAGR